MNVVKEALEGDRTNEVFGNLEQLLSSDDNTLDTVFSAINAAAKEAFAKLPVPEATDADTAIALVRELEKLPARVTQPDSSTAAGGDRPTKRAKHATADGANSSKARDKSKPVASATATSSKPTVNLELPDRCWTQPRAHRRTAAGNRRVRYHNCL